MLDQPERPLGDGAAERLDARGDVVLRVDGLADVVQQGGQQELLVVGPRVAGQLEDLQAVKERIALGMIPGVLLDRFQRLQPHLVDGEPVEMIGHRGDAGRLLARDPSSGRGSAGPAPPVDSRQSDDELLADLGVGREVARPDAVAQHGRRLPLGHVEVVGARPRRASPARGSSSLGAIVG